MCANVLSQMARFKKLSREAKKSQISPPAPLDYRPWKQVYG